MTVRQKLAIAYAIKDLRIELGLSNLSESPDMNPDTIAEVLERLQEAFPSVSAKVDQFEMETEKWEKSHSAQPKSTNSLELWEPRKGCRVN